MATKKKAAAKKAAAVKPKAAKKPAVSKTKSKAAAKKTAPKAKPKAAAAVKPKAPAKATPKKAAPKKATVKTKIRAAKKPVLKAMANADMLEAAPLPAAKPGSGSGIDIDVTFKGASSGSLTATLFRANGQETGKVTNTGTISFSNVVKGDAISLNGSCAGSTIINANRKVRTGSGKPLPLTIPGVILESLDILQ